MERIKWHKKLDRPPIPADVFDLIGGTSTGGLVFRVRTHSSHMPAHFPVLLQYFLVDSACQPLKPSDTTKFSPRSSSLRRKPRAKMEPSKRRSSRRQLKRC